MAARVLLIHGSAAEAPERLARLEGAGFPAELFTGNYGAGGYLAIRDNPPDVLVIDLSRRPSHGREIAIHIRRQPATRQVRLVFVEGDAEQTSQIASILPDATFTTWPRIGSAVKKALAAKLDNPVVPGTFAGYSGTPLPRKLRIGEKTTAALLHAPPGFETKLEPLPDGARLQRRLTGANVILAFMDSAARLRQELPLLAREIKEGRTLWLIWPKKASGRTTDLSEREVRALGLAAGLVDYKICAVDDTWSGLAFAARRSRRANA